MNLLRSFSIIGFFTFFSRILGFIRDSVIAYFFGVSEFTDSYFLALRIPNFFRRIFAEGAFTQSFIPILSEYKNLKDIKNTKKFISCVFGFLILFLIIFVLLGIKFSSFIIYFISPGFKKVSNQFNLSVVMLKIIFPYIFLISLVSLFNSILSVWNYYHVFSVSSLFFNFSIILSVLFLKSFFDPSIKVLAFGVLLGGFLQLLYCFSFLKRVNILVFPNFFFFHSSLKKLMKLMFPSLISSLISQISLFCNTIFTSFLESGSISWIYYADRIIDFPVGILGATFSSILLPILTKNFLEKKHKNFQILIDSSMKICFFFVFPTFLGLILLSQPLILSLFQYGSFTFYDTQMTKNILISYSFGLIFLVFSKIFLSCFYSVQDFKTPVKISIITIFIVQLLNFIFFKNFKHIGLGLSFSFGSFLNFIIFYWILRRKLILILLNDWKKFLIKTIFSSIIMSIILFIMLILFPNWEKYDFLTKIFKLIFFVFFSVLVYFCSLLFFGFDYKKYFRILMHYRIK